MEEKTQIEEEEIIFSDENTTPIIFRTEKRHIGMASRDSET